MGEASDPLTDLERDLAQPHGARHGFQEQLEEADRRLVAVGAAVLEQVRGATTAFLGGDRAGAEEVAARDQAIDRSCLDLEEWCYLLLARQSPVAADLRRVVAILRSVNDLQRSGDLARHVAESHRWAHAPSLPSALRDELGRLAETSSDVFARGLAAWKSHDGLAANELEQLDDRVDLSQKVLLSELYASGAAVEDAVTLALVARYYERIADHGVELARHVAYVLTGDRLPALDDME